MDNIDFNKIQEFAKLYQSGYLNNKFQGTVVPQPKPKYSDNTPPCYLERVQICRRDDGDRFYTEIKVWIKPPSFKFPKTGSFISFSNGKTNVFSRMTVDDLKALQVWLATQIPLIENKINELKPLELAQEQALKAYHAISSVPMVTSDDEPPIEIMEE